MASKRIVIVGASSGIGMQSALRFIEAGWSVGVAARRLEPLQELAERFPQQVPTERIDITEEDAPIRLNSLIHKLGGMDCYLHVSGIGFQNPELNPEVELNTVKTNSEGMVRMVDAAWQYFKKQSGGHIAVVSSIAGTKGLGTAPAYSATKAMQNRYLEALEQLSRMQRLNISITDIRPGFVKTDLLSDGQNYPMLMEVKSVSKSIYRAIIKRKRRAIIDWRYRVLVLLWRLIPTSLWVRLNIRTKSKK